MTLQSNLSTTAIPGQNLPDVVHVEVAVMGSFQLKRFRLNGLEIRTGNHGLFKEVAVVGRGSLVEVHYPRLRNVSFTKTNICERKLILIWFRYLDSVLLFLSLYLD